jgi:translation initiation factor IF-1
MPRITEYGGADPKHDGEIELHPGDEIRLKATSKHAHLAGSHRLGRVERVDGDRLLVRLRSASFWLNRAEILRRGWTP